MSVPVPSRFAGWLEPRPSETAQVHVQVRTVDIHVGRRRKELNRRGDRDPIRTVRSSGYALDETYTG